MRRFFAARESFDGDRVVLDERETRHLRDVLRLGIGNEVYVIDGEGREYRCRVEAINRNNAQLAIIEEAAPKAPESPLDLTLAAAVLKGDNFDLVIQKAVELGVTSFVPLLTTRTDARIGEPVRKLERWQRIVMEATKQCGRTRLMSVASPTRFTDLIDRIDRETAIVFAETGGSSFETIAVTGRLTAIVGPAGGWDDAELETARRARVRLVTFGGRILRAETAAISVAAILQHRFGDLS